MRLLECFVAGTAARAAAELAGVHRNSAIPFFHKLRVVIAANQQVRIEKFCTQAKRHLRKYNGIPKHHFLFFLKECEWLFNHRRQNIYSILLKNSDKIPSKVGKTQITIRRQLFN